MFSVIILPLLYISVTVLLLVIDLSFSLFQVRGSDGIGASGFVDTENRDTRPTQQVTVTFLASVNYWCEGESMQGGGGVIGRALRGLSRLCASC